ncbi:hypothetical protein [Streptomyces cellulosae]|uniref:Uncharacterized protein n=1 Tax=Streptomyces cellulosae TaxID=1968 RepID=A0ABW7YFW5_STRCE
MAGEVQQARVTALDQRGQHHLLGQYTGVGHPRAQPGPQRRHFLDRVGGKTGRNHERRTRQADTAYPALPEHPAHHGQPLGEENPVLTPLVQRIQQFPGDDAVLPQHREGRHMVELGPGLALDSLRSRGGPQLYAVVAQAIAQALRVLVACAGRGGLSGSPLLGYSGWICSVARIAAPETKDLRRVEPLVDQRKAEGAGRLVLQGLKCHLPGIERHGGGRR